MTGYRLVACSLSGANAFFVHREDAGPFPAYPPAVLYQPARHHLAQIRAGHAPSLRWRRQQIAREG